ncbi:MAG: hypothetical protein CMO55_16825 [Verrucomicrobiales bacterium]|nr:hypothetical protein [Verrucomicrobiales bacterium]
MPEVPHPEFPALLVELDGSLEVLGSNDEWTEDVDHWFWATSEVFLVDRRLRKFNLIADRAQDGRPNDTPEWQYSSVLDRQFVEGLIRNNPDLDQADAEIGLFFEAITGS